MDEFERQLSEALKRKDPPDGFERRVLAAAMAREARPVKSWRWVGAIAALLALTGGIGWQREHERDLRERAAGERATAQLRLALKVTSAKLNKIVETAYTHPAEGE